MPSSGASPRASSTRDVRRLGLVILALSTLLIVAVVLPYWRAFGLR